MSAMADDVPTLIDGEPTVLRRPPPQQRAAAPRPRRTRTFIDWGMCTVSNPLLEAPPRGSIGTKRWPASSSASSSKAPGRAIWQAAACVEADETFDASPIGIETEFDREGEGTDREEEPQRRGGGVPHDHRAEPGAHQTPPAQRNHREPNDGGERDEEQRPNAIGHSQHDVLRRGGPSQGFAAGVQEQGQHQHAGGGAEDPAVHADGKYRDALEHPPAAAGNRVLDALTRR